MSMLPLSGHENSPPSAPIRASVQTSWVTLTERQCGLHGQRYAPPDTPPAPFYAEGFKRVIPFGYLPQWPISIPEQPSPNLPLPQCGVNSTLLSRGQMNQQPRTTAAMAVLRGAGTLRVWWNRQHTS